MGYNVFDVLGVNHKEVIMCRFLADLLSPDGMHGCGTLFLNTFFEEVLREHVNNERLMSHTTVLTEYVIDDARRIDIVIRNAHFFIPIEVKIYADEQEGQCYDYYACALKYGNEAKVVYLTRFGTEPSIYSRRQKNGTGEVPQEKLLCISWMDDICGWLEKVVEKLDGQIKMLVTQYIDAISQFTDGRSVRVMDKSLEILSESVDFFEAGLQIEKTMKMKFRIIRMRIQNTINSMIVTVRFRG